MHKPQVKLGDSRDDGISTLIISSDADTEVELRFSHGAVSMIDLQEQIAALDLEEHYMSSPKVLGEIVEREDKHV